MLRYLSAALVALTVVATGCEQIKALRKLPELEGKVDALGNQVATLSGSGAGSGSGSGSAKEAKVADGKTESKPGDKKADEKKPDDKEAKPDDKGEKKADDKEAKADEKKADDKGEKDDKAAKAEDKGEKKADDKDDKAAQADDKKPDSPAKSDPALARLLAVVAENTGGKGKSFGPWSYDGKTGPAAWATLDPAWKACGGQAQSPIDIEPRAGTASPIEFTYKPTPATVIDTGHSLQVNLGTGSEIEIGDTVYQLVQIHFHTPSEHTIAGEHYPLEVQLVHQDASGKLAIISVLYDSGADSRPLGQLWSAWPHKLGAAQKLAQPIDPSLLLPETRTVFRYTGSLTQPPCSEGVSWNVMRRTLSDSKAHLAAFALHYPHNAREVQPLGDRKIE